MSTMYYPPCNSSYGRMHERDQVVRCEGWHYPGRRIPRCTWRSCTAPDRVSDSDDDALHFCPGGIAEARFAPGGK